MTVFETFSEGGFSNSSYYHCLFVNGTGLDSVYKIDKKQYLETVGSEQL